MDVTPPEFTNCPAGLVTLCSYISHQNFTTFITTWPIPVATDDSGQVTVVQTAGPISGMTTITYGIVYTVTYKATDPTGNSVLCTFSIMIDEEPPVLTYCPGNLTVCSPTEPWPFPTATDNCGFTYYIQFEGPVSGMSALVPGIIYTVRYRFFDRFGNYANDCVFSVSLESEPPVFSNCPANLTVCSPTEPWPVPTATDNCSQVTLVQVAGPVSGVDALVPGVVYTVGYRATGSCGQFCDLLLYG
jgi:large repetitive protein